MSNPQKVIDFLDIFGQWDASLAFVMMGAITIAVIPFQKVVRQTQPKTVFNEAIELPSNQCIDSKLIIGSLIFGIGWGVAGICPAPSFTLIGLGYYQVLYFIVAMLIGVAGGEKIPRKGGPGITKSDLLIINKTDLAPMVGANLDVMDQDAKRMRGDKPFLFSNMKTKDGLNEIIEFIEKQGLFKA